MSSILERAKKNRIRIQKKQLNKIAQIVHNTYSEFSSKYYPHQIVAIDKIKNHHENFGYVLMPTGSGKTKVQVGLILEDMELSTTPNNYVIASHRLLLNKQILNELIQTAAKQGEKFNILFVGSGQDISVVKMQDMIDDDTQNEYKIQEDSLVSSTRKDDIGNFISKTNLDGKHTIIVSTYHSVHKLEGNNISLACFDEAHSTAGKNEEHDFRINLQKVIPSIKRYYFFTATAKYGENKNDKLGMHADMYGDEIYSVSPREIIDGGYICEPQLHLVSLQDKSKTRYFDDLSGIKMQAKVIMESFIAHNRVVEENSMTSGYTPTVRAKMLVNTTGSKSMGEFIKSKEMLEFSKNNKVKLFFIASHENIQNTIIIDGVKQKGIDKSKWMKNLKNLSDDDAAIIFHIRMLTEGIDLPDITGTLFMNAKDTIPLLQSVGRALRRSVWDRNNLFVDKTVFPMDTHKMNKPYGYVILPEGFFIEDGEQAKMKDIIETIIHTYKMPVENMKLTTTDSKGITKKEELDGTGAKDDSKKTLKGIVEDIQHSIVLNESEKDYYKKYDIQEDIWIKELNIAI